MKKLIPAICMLLIAASLLGTSTFAWFSMNSKVTVTGMEVRTKISNNLLIAKDGVTNTSVLGEEKFKTSDVDDTPTIINALLEPVSSVDGVTFYYDKTNNVAADGNSASDVYQLYNPADTTAAFATNYDATGALGYVDYAFQLKAVNSGDAVAYVNLTEVKLTYGGTADTETAWRVAVFVDNMGETGSTPATLPSTTNLKSILRVSGAKYFGTGTGSSADKSDKAVNSTTTIGDVNAKIDDAALIGEVAAGKTNYYRVVVRLWLEGEDTTCTNTKFATLNDKWALDLNVQLDNATGGATNITGNVTTAKVDLSQTTAAADSETVVIDTITYYPITGKKIGDNQLYATATTVTADSHIYIIDGGHPIDVTNECALFFTVKIINNNSTVVTSVPATFNARTGAMEITATGITSDNSTITCSTGITAAAETGKITISEITANGTITITAKSSS